MDQSLAHVVCRVGFSDQLKQILVLVRLITNMKSRKLLPVCWMEVGNILWSMRITKETGCLLAMSHGSKHLYNSGS